MSKQESSGPKWAALVDDRIVPMPQQKVGSDTLRFQARVPDGQNLAQDFTSQRDKVLADGEEVDLGEGNVFRTVSDCGSNANGHANGEAKLAVFLEDDWELITRPDQTGRSLRDLFGLEPIDELFRDYESPKDTPISDDEVANFADGPVFRKGVVALVRIIVNGTPKSVSPGAITYGALVELAFENPPDGPNTSITAAFSGGGGSNGSGTLVSGQSVCVIEGMVFNVTATDKS